MPSQRIRLLHVLHEAGWLPNHANLAFENGDDLLPSILATWADYDCMSLPKRERLRFEEKQSWLLEQMTSGAQLTSLPITDDQLGISLGDRLVWWPHGRPDRRLVGIVSSRLGRRLDKQVAWLSVFRAACSKINRDHDVLLTAASTTPEQFVQRAAELFGVQVVLMICPREAEKIPAWFNRVIHQQRLVRRTNVFPGFVSPELHTLSAGALRRTDLTNTPLRDRIVVSLSQKLLVFHLRRAGHLDRLVRAKLESANTATGSVVIALGAELIKRDYANELLDSGAVGWVVLSSTQSDLTSTSFLPKTDSASIVELPTDDDWHLLTHCTRSQSDGWPDQCWTNYLDELLLNTEAMDRSAFASLQRIIAMQRLIATSRMIRGNTAVVCFTAVPVNASLKLRTFRSHLGRWDFEPYGICIDRRWLQERGCAPVAYGDASLWDSLTPRERPFFQMQASTTRRTSRVIDWTVEQEWRHVGDLVLNELPKHKGIVFVPTEEEAKRLAVLSRWPVAVLDGARTVD
ncbi:MAG: hypothetical protein H6822_36400 [Planctomycetaceae bacterium]|nr:hypothetical protein [Planctomycetales bacterium]MCB9927670.1 hypothetical protein [Planctomycetaceae bacterium]